MKSKNSIAIITVVSFMSALLVWQFLFYNNPYLKDAIPDVQIIFISVLFVYSQIKIWVKDFLLDFIKVFIRTLFRVWLLIFITFAIMQTMKRVGVVLSMTFIFGYFEGLLDIDKWLSASNPFNIVISENVKLNRRNHALLTIMLMSWIHILCAFVVKGFSEFVGVLV